MLIGRLGSHHIYRSETNKWRCSCGASRPPCEKMKIYFRSMREHRRPPSRFRFTAEGAAAAISDCRCLSDVGATLVRKQIELDQPEPPPAPTGRNAPCPCGSGGKFKRCCGWEQEDPATRGERRFFPPGAPAEGPELAAVAPVAPSKGDRLVRLLERRDAMLHRVDVAIDIERKADDAQRLVREARTLEQRARSGELPLFAPAELARAQELRARAQELRREATAERRARKAERVAALKIEHAAALERRRATDRARREARKQTAQ